MPSGWGGLCTEGVVEGRSLCVSAPCCGEGGGPSCARRGGAGEPGCLGPPALAGCLGPLSGGCPGGGSRAQAGGTEQQAVLGGTGVGNLGTGRGSGHVVVALSPPLPQVPSGWCTHTHTPTGDPLIWGWPGGGGCAGTGRGEMWPWVKNGGEQGDTAWGGGDSVRGGTSGGVVAVWRR